MTRVVVLRSLKENDSYALVSLYERNVDLMDFNPCPYSYQQAMQEAGFSVKFIPTLHFDFVSQRELSDAVSNLSHYSGILYTPLCLLEIS